MQTIQKLEKVNEQINEAINVIIQAVAENESLKDYYGNTLNNAKENLGVAQCTVEKVIENHQTNWH